MIGNPFMQSIIGITVYICDFFYLSTDFFSLMSLNVVGWFTTEYI